MGPIRIQRRRAKGYNMQAVSRAANGRDCVSVTRPGRFGNPYDIKIYGRDLSLALFRNTAQGIWDPTLLEDHRQPAAVAAHQAFLKRNGENPLQVIRQELKGKNLACYCPLTEPCHADIYLELAAPEMP